MYRDTINSADQALVHLAFHCSLKDGQLQPEELEFLSSTFVAKGLNKNLDLKTEMQQYEAYKESLKDESAYLEYLIQLIHPVNKLALYGFCTEIVFRDGHVSLAEEIMLNKIAALLHVKDSENLTIQKLISEMNEVEKRNAF